MKKAIFYLLLITILGAFTVSSRFKKTYTEKEFLEKINTETFSKIQLKELIENTIFETINTSMINICNGSESDYCPGPPLPNGTRLKCCITIPPQN